MLQRGQHVLAMSFRQVGDSRRQRAEEMRDTVGRLAVGRRRSPKARSSAMRTTSEGRRPRWRDVSRSVRPSGAGRRTVI